MKGVTIQLYHATAPGALPPPGSLIEGEIAMDALSNPPRLWTAVPTSRDPSGRLDLLSTAVGGAIPLPLTILNGGTGATTPNGAFDNLTGAAGTMTGWLSRTPAGTWNLMGPTDLAFALSGTWLPISNPTYAGLLTTPVNGTVIRFPTLLSQSAFMEWGPVNGQFAVVAGKPVAEGWGTAGPNTYAIEVGQGYRTVGANDILTANGATSIFQYGEQIEFYVRGKGPLGQSAPHWDPRTIINPRQFYIEAPGNWEAEIDLMNKGGGTAAMTTLYMEQDPGPTGWSYAQWSLVGAANIQAGPVAGQGTGEAVYWGAGSAVLRAGAVPRGFNICNDTNNSPIRFRLGNPFVNVAEFHRFGMFFHHPHSLTFGTRATAFVGPLWSPVTVNGLNTEGRDETANIGVWCGTLAQSFASYYLGGNNVQTPSADPGGVTRWSMPNRSANLGATAGESSNNVITNVHSHSWSFYEPLATPPYYYEHTPSLWLTRNGLWVPSWIPNANASQGCWIGGANGLIDLGGWSDIGGWSAAFTIGAYNALGGARIDLEVDNGVFFTMSLVGSGTGGNRANLNSNAPGGMYIQNWAASPAGGIHFTVGKLDEDGIGGEIFEQIDIDEHGLHMPNTWHDDDGVTIDDSGQNGLEIAAGGLAMLGSGSGLLMLTATTAPNSTAVFLLGNHRVQLVSTSNGNGWVANGDPVPKGKLGVFWRGGKYYVGNGRATSVHLNDMMFKNAED